MKTLTGYFLNKNRIVLGVKNLKKTDLKKIALDGAILISGGERDFYKNKPTQDELIRAYNSEEKCDRAYPTSNLITPEPITIQYE